jgi:hypothetical protein
LFDPASAGRKSAFRSKRNFTFVTVSHQNQLFPVIPSSDARSAAFRGRPVIELRCRGYMIVRDRWSLLADTFTLGFTSRSSARRRCRLDRGSTNRNTPLLKLGLRRSLRNHRASPLRLADRTVKAFRSPPPRRMLIASLYVYQAALSYRRHDTYEWWRSRQIRNHIFLDDVRFAPIAAGQ